MSETQTEYEVAIKRQSAFDGQFAYLWIEKLWPSVTLKSRGSEMRHGYSLFPRGQLVVKFDLSVTAKNPDRGIETAEEPTEDQEITVEQLADLLEQSINVLTTSYKAFVTIEDSQDAVRDGDF